MGCYTFNGNNTNVAGYNPAYVAGRIGDSPNLVIAVDYNTWRGIGGFWDYSVDLVNGPATSHHGVNVLYVDGHVTFSPFTGNSTNGFYIIYMGSGNNYLALKHN